MGLDQPPIDGALARLGEQRVDVLVLSGPSLGGEPAQCGFPAHLGGTPISAASDIGPSGRGWDGIRNGVSDGLGPRQR